MPKAANYRIEATKPGAFEKHGCQGRHRCGIQPTDRYRTGRAEDRRRTIGRLRKPRVWTRHPPIPAGYCKHCGYDLRGLPSPRCPECGKDFDPANPRTFARRPPRSPVWRWAKRLTLLLLAAIALLAGTWGWFYWGWRQEQQALAKLSGFSVEHIELVVPPWLVQRVGPAGFVFRRTIELSGEKGDLSLLARFKRLQTLDLYSEKAQDLSPLSKLTGLTHLTLEAPCEDLSPLSSLPRLQVLHILQANICDLSSLAKLTQLRELYLTDTPEDLSPLSTRTALQVLVIDSNIRNVSFLAKMTGLRTLALIDPSVRDLSPLSGLVNLRYLDLSELGTASTPTDLSPLSGLTSLESLNLAGARVRDLSPLSRMTALQWLNLRWTNARDLSPLSNLTRLKDLNLMDTPVRDVAPIAKLAALESLDLGGTRVRDLSPLVALIHLKDLRVPKATPKARLEELRRALSGCDVQRDDGARE